MEVIAADDAPRITDALQEDDYRHVVELLETHYNLICMDTGTGVLESASKGILQLADHLVLVAGPNLDSARAASATLDWLDKNGPEDLVAGAVAVVNGVPPRGMVDLDHAPAWRARSRICAPRRGRPTARWPPRSRGASPSRRGRNAEPLGAPGAGVVSRAVHPVTARTSALS